MLVQSGAPARAIIRVQRLRGPSSASRGSATKRLRSSFALRQRRHVPQPLACLSASRIPAERLLERMARFAVSALPAEGQAEIQPCVTRVLLGQSERPPAARLGIGQAARVQVEVAQVPPSERLERSILDRAAKPPLGRPESPARSVDLAKFAVGKITTSQGKMWSRPTNGEEGFPVAAEGAQAHRHPDPMDPRVHALVHPGGEVLESARRKPALVRPHTLSVTALRRSRDHGTGYVGQRGSIFRFAGAESNCSLQAFASFCVAALSAQVEAEVEPGLIEQAGIGHFDRSSVAGLRIDQPAGVAQEVAQDDPTARVVGRFLRRLAVPSLCGVESAEGHEDLGHLSTEKVAEPGRRASSCLPQSSKCFRMTAELSQRLSEHRPVPRGRLVFEAPGQMLDGLRPQLAAAGALPQIEVLQRIRQRPPRPPSVRGSGIGFHEPWHRGTRSCARGCRHGRVVFVVVSSRTLHSVTPMAGPARVVRYRQYPDSPGFDRVEHAVRESLHQPAADSRLHDCAGLGMSDDLSERALNSIKEYFTQPR